MKISISTLLVVAVFALSACSNTWTGVGKDLQEMGKKMDPQGKPVETAPKSNTPSNPNNKDVTVTPVN